MSRNISTMLRQIMNYEQEAGNIGRADVQGALMSLYEDAVIAADAGDDRKLDRIMRTANNHINAARVEPAMF